MSGPGNARPHTFRVAEHSHLTPWLAALHAQCISHDRMIGTFLPPLSHEKLLGWWKERIAEVRAGTRSIIMLLDESEPGAKFKGEELVGVVMLSTPPLETAPFRASVESLLVSTKYRRRGGATMLLRAVHEEAYRAKKTLLVSLQTDLVFRQSLFSERWQCTYNFVPSKLAEVESGTPAEALLKQMQYQEIGKVPKYAINPSGETKDIVFLYRDLKV